MFRIRETKAPILILNNPFRFNLLVRFKLVNTVLAVCLALSIGGHWVLLQSVAWMGMAVTYSKTSSSFGEVLSKTFDGKHPCGLCKFVQEGKAADEKHDIHNVETKLDCCQFEDPEFYFPPATQQPIFLATAFYDHLEAPPVPPPRVS